MTYIMHLHAPLHAVEDKISFYDLLALALSLSLTPASWPAPYQVRTLTLAHTATGFA